MTSNGSMDWITPFYSTTGRWWGPAESRVSARDHARAETIQRLVPHAKRVLELGSSYGNTAAACAERGFDVVAVEISERVGFAQPFAARTYPGSLHLVHADFLEVDLAGGFDAVAYWNGFGVGTDADQRRLLQRISSEWLQANGVALIEVANPIGWALWAGREEQKAAQPERGYHYAVSHRIDFDPARSRFIDTWWQTEVPEAPVSQSIRCYTPTDLVLLLEGTRLELARVEVGGQHVELADDATAASPLWHAHEYLAMLQRPSQLGRAG